MYVVEGARLLAVNGVLPTKETISSQEYPLTTAYYAVIKSNEPSDSPARKLLNWLLSDEGQSVADKAGYVPLRMLHE
jgi:phosphate transport system substrate-binding protein